MSTIPFQSYKHHFLVAMPSLQEGIFANSITYLCEHTEQGAMGIVINQPLQVCLDEIFEHLDMDGDCRHDNEPIMAGGPVQTDRGFVLHRPTGQQWDSTLVIADDVAMTTSKDILEAMARGAGPEQALVALGYAGWGAGQLEEELARNAWLTLPADSRIIFDTPIEQRAQLAVGQLGIDLHLIAPGAGHA
ncbi:MAG TPA: YqgE/AlgH family protein [Spongiibacteraceae bacterium]|jgi:putative transcriptional regulator|nr:YqgE/AlgH family protein [Spongiibacteraceae bacterium]HUH38561.1 YqgE/AlgH family protein [Spongiibacteraceae bacterium]